MSPSRRQWGDRPGRRAGRPARSRRPAGPPRRRPWRAACSRHRRAVRRARTVRNGIDKAEQDHDRQPADDDAPIGHHEGRRDVEDLRPDLVQDLDDVHGRILSVPPVLGALRGIAFLGRRAAPGLPGRRSVSAGSPSCWLAAVSRWRSPRAGRGLPTDGEARRPVPRRPSSQADPAVRAPRMCARGAGRGRRSRPGVPPNHPRRRASGRRR